ncbi:hypothetical protein QEJ31_02225 [Pigmentibacter sp. JX0631]|uniref:hypothetical protein n=1 Tax=Pigmentibacter sp. JX0631 TaxID=2976982 RepID=UPI0024697696|nr:hypothetical protein [Pigmentibacter sp. JX0631]WGL60421.1 hypothetical protein QEJ31_02225 [Pigmentibacter sp. JX0631]
MRIKFHSLITLPSLFFITSAFSGTPTVNNKCYVGNINHPKNSMGIAFDEECSNAYVLPPEVGKVSVTAVQQNMNLGFCKTLNLVSESVKESESNRLEITKTITKMIKDYEPFKKEVDQLYFEMKKNESTFNAIKEQFDSLKVKEQKIGEEIDQAYLIYNKLKRKDPDSQETKNALLILEDLRKKYREFLDNEFNPVEDKYYISKKRYSVSKEEYEYEQNKYNENLKPLMNYKSWLMI